MPPASFWRCRSGRGDRSSPSRAGTSKVERTVPHPARARVHHPASLVGLRQRKSPRRIPDGARRADGRACSSTCGRALHAALLGGDHEEGVEHGVVVPPARRSCESHPPHTTCSCLRRRAQGVLLMRSGRRPEPGNEGALQRGITARAAHRHSRWRRGSARATSSSTPCAPTTRPLPAPALRSVELPSGGRGAGHNRQVELSTAASGRSGGEVVGVPHGEPPVSAPRTRAPSPSARCPRWRPAVRVRQGGEPACTVRSALQPARLHE